MDFNLYLFSALDRDPLMWDLMRFRMGDNPEAGRVVCRRLLQYAAAHGRGGDILRQYALEMLLDVPGAGAAMSRPELVKPYFEHDIACFYALVYATDWQKCCLEDGVLPFPNPQYGEEAPGWMQPMLRAGSPGELAEAVRAFFELYHDRDEAVYRAYRWEDGKLQGIAVPEQQRFDQLAGLKHQKQALLDNATAFLQGKPAHNVLLVGSSGTGKSSCVKATLTQFAEQGLRLIELPKQHVGELTRLTEALRGKRCKYIVYIDDLSFEEIDGGYKALKVALEGQVEEKPPNVLIYVTSNRRNLVRESWKDRDGQDEIHENDTLHEKRSLSERFGLRLSFGVLSQKEYFEVVRLLLEPYQTPFTEEIGKQAATFALQVGVRSGRTARQFVADLLARERGHDV